LCFFSCKRTAAGIDDVIKESGRVALHLFPNSTGLNPIELVCGDIRNNIVNEYEGNAGVSRKVFVEYTKEK
jgi:hypothetical protein